jgi:hypothetical protein
MLTYMLRLLLALLADTLLTVALTVLSLLAWRGHVPHTLVAQGLIHLWLKASDA